MAQKYVHPNGQVDSSFLTIFLVLAAGISMVFSFGGIYQLLTAATLWVVAVLMYVMWQVIVQMYEPGGAVLLFIGAFLVVPFISSLVFGFEARAGSMVFITAWVLALPIQWVYSRLMNHKRQAKGPYGTLLAIDRRFDPIGQAIHDKIFANSNSLALIVGAAILLLMVAASYVAGLLF